MIYLHTTPENNMTLMELLNRFPQYVAHNVQYNGWQLDELALDELKKRVDRQTYSKILKQSKHFPR